MIRLTRLISLMVGCWLLAYGTAIAQTKTKPEAAKETVAIFVIDNRSTGYGYETPFDSYTGSYYSDWQGRIVSNLQIELMTAIEEIGRWTVIDWQRLGAIQQLQKIMQSSSFDPETVVRSGKLFGVRWAIYVAIEHFAVTSSIGAERSVIFNQGFEAGFRQVTVNLQCSAWLVDVERGIVRYSIRGERASESTQVGSVRVPLDRNRFFITKQLGTDWLKAQPGRATRLIATRLTTKLTKVDLASCQFKPRLLVAKVDGQTVFLNQGEQAGIKANDRFLAACGSEIRDPDSGQLLGHSDYAIIQVIAVQPQFAMAKIIEGRQSTIQVGAELVPTSPGTSNLSDTSALAGPTDQRPSPTNVGWEYDFPLNYGELTIGQEGFLYRGEKSNVVARFTVLRAIVNNQTLTAGRVRSNDGQVTVRIKLQGKYLFKGDEQWHVPS